MFLEITLSGKFWLSHVLIFRKISFSHKNIFYNNNEIFSEKLHFFWWKCKSFQGNKISKHQIFFPSWDQLLHMKKNKMFLGLFSVCVDVWKRILCDPEWTHFIFLPSSDFCSLDSSISVFVSLRSRAVAAGSGRRQIHVFFRRSWISVHLAGHQPASRVHHTCGAEPSWETQRHEQSLLEVQTWSDPQSLDGLM